MYNKLLKKEEIINMLNNTKPILKNEIIEYLESIINLEFSVVKDNISDEERKPLTELQVYRSALIYNINKRNTIFFNKEYQKNGINFFNFSINSNDVPCIKLLINVAETNKEKLGIIKNYFYYLKEEYDLRENAIASGKKYIKKIPGLIIKKEFEK